MFSRRRHSGATTYRATALAVFCGFFCVLSAAGQKQIFLSPKHDVLPCWRRGPTIGKSPVPKYPTNMTIGGFLKRATSPLIIFKKCFFSFQTKKKYFIFHFGGTSAAPHAAARGHCADARETLRRETCDGRETCDARETLVRRCVHMPPQRPARSFHQTLVSRS